ncbi:ABC transporter permease subunit [Streptomyces sp. NPDC090023]|uniref:ABC transporter permease subunit n=1 Tax=unclassified Streptomyces TaxID=2593676 RepID=UPI0038250A14
MTTAAPDTAPAAPRVPPATADPAAHKVVPARHPARWAGAAAVLVLVAQFTHRLATNPVWEWRVFGDYVLSETIVQAVWVTLQLTAYAKVLGFLLGTVLAFMRLSPSPVPQTVAWTYIPRLRQIRRIVLPQAMRAILPTAGNEIIGLLKGTSVVYVMAIGELFYQVQVVHGRNGRIIPPLLVATAWYVLLTSLLSVAQYYVERRYARGADRTPPPTPLQRARRFLRDLRAAAARREAPVTALHLGGESR